MIGLLAVMGGGGIPGGSPGIGGIMSGNGGGIDGGSDADGRKVDKLLAVSGGGGDGRAVVPPLCVDDKEETGLDCGTVEMAADWGTPTLDEDDRAIALMGATELTALTDLRIFWRAFGSASRLPSRSIPPEGEDVVAVDFNVELGADDNGGNGSDKDGGAGEDDDSANG